MTARQLVAGTVDINVLSGGPVTVTVLAVSAGVDRGRCSTPAGSQGDGRVGTGVFFDLGLRNPDSQAMPPAATTPPPVLGDDPTPPNVNAAAAGHDFGDYGV